MRFPPMIRRGRIRGKIATSFFAPHIAKPIAKSCAVQIRQSIPQTMILRPIIDKALTSPKKLFLIDGLGALLSAFLLGIVLVQFEAFFGIPPSALYFLATLPLFFALFDAYAYRKQTDKIGTFLTVIAVLNFLYCVVSIGFAFYHFASITIWGWAYITGEILMVSLLAIVELMVGRIWVVAHY